MREHNSERALGMHVEPPGAREDREEIYERINEEYRAALLYEGPDAGELYDGDVDVPDGTPLTVNGTKPLLLRIDATASWRAIGGDHDDA